MENSNIKFKIKSTFDNVIKHWPKKISVNYSEDNKRVFPELSMAWNKVEEVVGYGDPWSELMVWVIYGVLHERALKTRDYQSIKYIYPQKIPFSDFLQEFNKQLQDEEWSFLESSRQWESSY